jgi:hypothetical protein
MSSNNLARSGLDTPHQILNVCLSFWNNSFSILIVFFVTRMMRELGYLEQKSSNRAGKELALENSTDPKLEVFMILGRQLNLQPLTQHRRFTLDLHSSEVL